MDRRLTAKFRKHVIALPTGSRFEWRDMDTWAKANTTKSARSVAVVRCFRGSADVPSIPMDGSSQVATIGSIAMVLGGIAGSAASERSISRTPSTRWTRRKSVTPHHQSLLFNHDAPTPEDILEGWKLMDAERKRVFAITLY